MGISVYKECGWNDGVTLVVLVVLNIVSCGVAACGTKKKKNSVHGEITVDMVCYWGLLVQIVLYLIIW